jgi:uncharacterized protein (TIGR02246 family)
MSVRHAGILALCGLAAGCGLAAPDRSADEQELRRLEREWFAAEARHDLEGTMAFWAPTAVLHTTGGEEVAGREALRKLMATLLPELIEIDGAASRVVVAPGGDMAFTLGSERLVVRTPDGPQERRLRYLMVYQKVGGRWKGVAGSVTPLRPPP